MRDIKKIIYRVALTAVFLMVSNAAEAQQPKKTARIGYLSATDPSTEAPRADAIRSALRELGYVEGQNIATDYRYAEGKTDRLFGLAAELVRLKVDVIVVAGGDLPVQAAKDATKTIPIVMSGAGIDPVKAGFVQSLARPGGNITGITSVPDELGGKVLELLKEVLPNAAHVAVLYDPTRPDSALDVKEVLPGTARALRLMIQPSEVRTGEDFDKIFAAIGKSHPDALYVPRRNPVIAANEKRIISFALKSRLPSIYYDRRGVEAGGLMSYGADLAGRYGRVAYYIDKILKGAKPADLPVEQPTKFELVINLKTAKQIGLTIPQSVLYKADRVIK
ncbi:MAG TPA: ABC transporter substrate-binding protein [Candidatus Binatia bacterium]